MEAQPNKEIDMKVLMPSFIMAKHSFSTDSLHVEYLSSSRGFYVRAFDYNMHWMLNTLLVNQA